MTTPSFSDIIIGLYKLGDSLEDHEMSFKLKMMANALAKLGNEYHRKNSVDSSDLLEKI
jgi:hypothetical protein